MLLNRCVRTMSCLLAFGLTLAGCSSAAVTDFEAADAYAAEFKQEYDLSDSDFVRSILADGKVEVSELQDAQRHLTTCMAEAGYSIRLGFDSDGLPTEAWETGHDTEPFTDAEMDAMQTAYGPCRDRWMGLADTLFQYVQTNPNNEDWDGLVAGCLVRHGMVAEGFTGQDHKELWQNANDDDDSTGMGPYLPGGRGLGEPEGQQCETVPLR